MKCKVQIKRINDKLAIQLPKSVITNAELKEGDKLEVNVKGKNLLIVNKPDNSEEAYSFTLKPTDDIYSKTLMEEQLILAK